MKLLRNALLALVVATAACSGGGTTSTPDTAADTAAADVADVVTSDVTSDVIDDTVAPDAVADATSDADADGVSVDGDDALDAADSAVRDEVSADDSGPDALDGQDGGPTHTVWGPISGAACGGLDAALTSPEPSFYTSTWEIDVTAFDPQLLDTGPAFRFSQPNAGGSSKCSEVMSMQWLISCEGAEYYQIETGIHYTTTTGSITDYELIIGGHKIGVSVTRAYLGPTVTDYTVAAATTLLTKKLEGVIESTANVAPDDAWVKQILHVWTLRPDWVPILEEAWDALSADLKSDTIVLVTVEANTTYIVTDTCDDGL